MEFLYKKKNVTPKVKYIGEKYILVPTFYFYRF